MEEGTVLTMQHLIHALRHIPAYPGEDVFDPECWICRQNEVDMLIFDAKLAGWDSEARM